MQHLELNRSEPFENEDQVLEYFRVALHLRARSRAASSEIARAVFTMTSSEFLNFTPSAHLSRIRDEFGALEAPGLEHQDSSEDEANEFEDKLWKRLEGLVLSQ